MSAQTHGITACAEGRDRAAGEIPLFTKETTKSAPGTLFLLAGMEGSHPAPCSPLPERAGENPALVNWLAADPKQDPRLPWPPVLPTRQKPPFRQLPRELLPQQPPQCSNSQGRE